MFAFTGGTTLGSMLPTGHPLDGRKLVLSFVLLDYLGIRPMPPGMFCVLALEPPRPGEAGDRSPDPPGPGFVLPGRPEPDPGVACGWCQLLGLATEVIAGVPLPAVAPPLRPEAQAVLMPPFETLSAGVLPPLATAEVSDRRRNPNEVMVVVSSASKFRPVLLSFCLVMPDCESQIQFRNPAVEARTVPVR